MQSPGSVIFELNHRTHSWCLEHWSLAQKEIPILQVGLGSKTQTSHRRSLASVTAKTSQLVSLFQSLPYYKHSNRISREIPWEPTADHMTSLLRTIQSFPKHTFGIKIQFLYSPLRALMACLFPPLWLPLRNPLTLRLVLPVAPALVSLRLGGTNQPHFCCLNCSYFSSPSFRSLLKGFFLRTFPCEPNIK